MSRRSVLVPLVTPFDDHGGVCRESVARLLESLRGEVAGFVPCLTSGEGWALDRTQWREMLSFCLALAGQAAVIAGIERAGTDDVLDYAIEAERMGAAAIMVTSPFGPDVGQDAIHRHYRTLHDRTGLDIYIYNESALSRNEVTFDTLLAIAELPRVVGIKDSSERGGDPDEIRALHERGVAYYVGWEQRLTRIANADGAVVSLANLEPALCGRALGTADCTLQAEVDGLTRVHGLLTDDWYRHVKRTLEARGVIASDRVVAQPGAQRRGRDASQASAER